MKQYMMSVYDTEDENTLSDEELQQIYVDVDVFNQEVRDADAWVFGGGLHPASTATVVNVDRGEVLVTDGPFAESKEHIGGFWVINAPDLDAALQWAAKGATACRGAVEVRPFQDDPGE